MLIQKATATTAKSHSPKRFAARWGTIRRCGLSEMFRENDVNTILYAKFKAN
jgi:hypothetical protein